MVLTSGTNVRSLQNKKFSTERNDLVGEVTEWKVRLISYRQKDSVSNTGQVARSLHYYRWSVDCIVTSTLPGQCWKSKVQALPQVIWFFPEAREFSRPINAKSVFRQLAFPWNYPIGLCYHVTLFVGVAVDVTAIMPRFLFLCTSKFSLIASYFCLIVSNLLSLRVQLPQTKAAFSAPKYCESLPLERQNQIVSCKAVADFTVLGKFRLVLAPELQNDASTEQIMHLPITVIWVLFLSMFWGFLQSVFSTFEVFANRNKSSAARCKQISAEKVILKERVWLTGLKQGKCVPPGGHLG